MQRCPKRKYPVRSATGEPTNGPVPAENKTRVIFQEEKKIHKRPPLHNDYPSTKATFSGGQIIHTLGAIHSTKISGNFGPKLNGSVLSNRKSFKKTGPPIEVDQFSWSDRSESWLNGLPPLDSCLNLSTTATSLQREPLSPVPEFAVVEGFNCFRKRCSIVRGLFCCCCSVFCFI